MADNAPGTTFVGGRTGVIIGGCFEFHNEHRNWENAPDADEAALAQRLG